MDFSLTSDAIAELFGTDHAGSASPESDSDKMDQRKISDKSQEINETSLEDMKPKSSKPKAPKMDATPEYMKMEIPKKSPLFRKGKHQSRLWRFYLTLKDIKKFNWLITIFGLEVNKNDYHNQTFF